ncbi:hypothetical protein [Sphingobacterium corticibacter]|uniref:DUF4369 domain-containing protein n=1 Tax=Sphingobacterium corticibacter TaxID=2171749 RepID=A0A2T8HIH8_9SPHI|nr:hypothetical protein [Sphingobacterium corticibacter]PVH25193.1 hypothetical protein DC487_09715 [Sphingobacterium corticibacter]
MNSISVPILATLFFAVLLNNPVIAQQGEINQAQRSNASDCKCPENIYTSSAPNQVFTYSNGKKIVACGYVMDEQQPDVLSEFVLAECETDTVIDFWGAMTISRLAFKQDTLFVQELYELPIGDDFKSREIVWTIEKFSYNGSQLMREKRVNHDLILYDDNTIKKVLERYKAADDVLNDDKMLLADQLFTAALSGHTKAKSAFLGFHQRFPALSGAYLQQYRILTEMLTAWEKEDEAL